MTEPLTPMQLDTASPASDQVKRTLGLLSGQLKGSSALTLPPTSAVEMKGRVEQRYTAKPADVSQPAAPAEPSGRESTAADATNKFQSLGMDLFSEILKTNATIWSLMEQKGLLSPETQQEIKARETQKAKREVAEREAAAIAATSRKPPVHPLAAVGIEPPLQILESDYYRRMEEKANARVARNTQERLDRLYEDAAGEQELKTYAWWYDAGNRVVKGALDVGVSVPEWLSQWTDTMEAWRTGSEIEKSKYRENVEAARKLVDIILPTDDERDEEFLAQLSQGTGSMLGFMIMGYVARTMGGPGQSYYMGQTQGITSAGTAQAIGIGGAGAATQGSQSFRDASRFDADTIQKTYALFAGSALGVSELIPISRMLTRAEMATGGLVSRAIANTTAGSIEEFVQEFGQGVLADAIASTKLGGFGWDPNREYDWGGYISQGLIGAITGGAVGGAATLASGKPGAGGEEPATSPEEQAGLDIIADEQARIDEIKATDEGTGDTVDPATELPDPAAEPQAAETPEAEPVNLPAETADADADTQAMAVDVQASEPAAYTPPQPTAADYAARAAEPMVKAAGGHIRVNADGLVELSHWSPVAGLETLDPTKQGTGPLRGEERRRLFPGDKHYTERVYYGVNAVENMPAREARQLDTETRRRGGYRKEGGLGGNRYTVLVEPDRLYNWYEDPAGIRDQLDRTAPSSEQITQYEFLIREAGWDGIFFEEGQTGQAVIMFTPETPIETFVPDAAELMATPDKRAAIEQANPAARVVFDRAQRLAEQPAAAPVRPSDFEALTAEALTRPGYAVLTANLQEFGPPDSPENMRRNSELRADLEAIGAQPIEAEGVYKGTPDGTVFIAFMSEDEAQALGRKYQQESILTNRGLVFMDGSSVTADHANSVVGDEAEQRDFYTVMPNGTLWSMGLNEEDMGGPDLMAADDGVRGDVVSGTELKGDGRKFTNFFADVTRGVRQQPTNLEGYQPAIPPTETMKAFAAIRTPFSGSFENHIQTSIPGYRETQDAVGVALVNAFGETGADVLDIGGSEGAMLKAAADVTRGKVHGTILDPNPAMKQTFDEKPSVRGVTYAMEAFSSAEEAGQLAWTEDDGTEIYNFEPKRKYDVAYEAMVFQFISNSRNAQIARVKEMLKRDGVFISQEKLGGPADYYNANEVKKDEYKALYYDAETLEAKRQEVLQTGGDAVEGMTDLQVTDAEFRRSLANNFRYVVQFWDSGNFKGYAASDSAAKLQAFVDALPSDLQSEYATRPTPAMVARGDEDIDFSGLTASNRDAYVGEPASRGFVPDTDANKPAPEDSDLTLSAIASNLVEAVGATVRQGRLARKQGMKVMGQFHRKTGVTRLRFKDDVITMAHELGHHLHTYMGDPLTAWVSKHSLELRKAGKKMYPGDLSNETKTVQEREGFAEFFRVFVTNRDYARRHFAKLTGDFETLLSATDPKMGDKLDAIGMQLRAWINLPSQSKLRNQIVSNRRPEGIDAALKELAEAGIPAVFDEWARRTMQASVNRYASLNKLVDQMLSAYEETKGTAFDLKLADDPRVLARLARNSVARAMVQIKHGVMGYRSTQARTKGIRDILLTIHDRTSDQELHNVDQRIVEDFNTYIVALRGLDEWRREAAGLIERAPVFTKAPELRGIASELEAKYGKRFTRAAAMVNEYNRAEWEKAYDAGLISQETYEQGNTRQFYAPLQRDMSDRGLTQYGQLTVTAPRSFVKRFRGSDRDIIAPLDIMMQKTMSLEATIAFNEVGRSLAQLADKLGPVGFGVERIPAYQIKPVQIEVAQAMRQLTQLDSLTAEDANDLATMLQASAESGDRLTVFRQDPALLAGINALQFWENGRLSAVQLADGEIGADVVDVIEGLGRENLDFGLGFVAHGATLVRTTVTKWPDFILVNFVRDQFSAYMLNRGYVPFLSGLRGLANELAQSDWAQKYNAAMGLMGGMNAATVDQARVGKDIQAALPKSYVRSAFAGRGLQRAANGFSRITEMTETGTRLGLFQSAYKRAKADGLTDWEAAIEASYRATDLIDFGLNGSRMLHARRLVPFLNAQIQGLYKMVRTLGGDEAARRKGYKFAVKAYFKDINGLDLSRSEKEALKTGRALWLKMGIISLFSAALHFLQEDDPDYQHASEYMRNSNWVITPAVHGGEPGRMITIPKPFELALLANFTERALEHFGGDMAAKDRFMRGVMLAFSPPDGTPFYTLYNELRSNFDTFSKREIVPFYMQSRPPQQQYTEYTTDFAKWLGEEMGWSPLQIDHVMSALGTSAYRDLTTIGGQFNPNSPDTTKADWMILRRFWRKSAAGATASRDFWELASSRRGEFEQAAAGYKTYKENGDPVRAESFLMEQDDDAMAYAIMKTEFEADVERLHPMRRAVDVSGVASAMKREIKSGLGLYSTAEWRKYEDNPAIGLSPRQKSELIELLTDVSLRTTRNALIATSTPGWADKEKLDVAYTLEMIREISSDAYDELMRRTEKKKIYSESAVEAYWPTTKERAIESRDSAFFDDLIAIAKARGAFE